MTDTSSTSNFSVLLVEDQPDVAESLRMYLQLACGYKVTVAKDGQAGVEAAIRELPDAIVCDIGLPKRDGFQVAAEVTRTFSRKPVLVAMSGYSRPDYIERAKEAGFDDYFLKGTDPAALVESLRSRAGQKGGSPAAAYPFPA